MRLLMIAVLALSLTGCDWYLNGKPKVQEGEVKETQTLKQKRNVEAEVIVAYTPTDKPGPITVMDFFDSKISVPANTQVNARVTSDYNSRQSDFYSLIGSFNYKSGMGQLIFIGALCIAGGAVLCYFGMWTIGVGLALFGFMLIACGIAIDKYPGVFIGVLVLGLVAVVAFVIYTIKHKNATVAVSNTEAVLAEICNKIEALKKVNPEMVKTFITDELKKSDISGKIKEIVSSVKG